MNKYEISSDGSIWSCSRFEILNRSATWSKSRYKIVNRDDIPWKDAWKPTTWKKYIILDTSTGQIRGTSDSHEWCFHKICTEENKEEKGGKL